MIKFFVFFFLTPFIAKAEIIQVPEICLDLVITPCLVRSSNQEALQSKDKKYSYLVGADTITKWVDFGAEPKVDLLEGTLYVKKTAAGPVSFNVNGIKLTANSFFIFREERKLKILDGEKFLLSEYQLGLGKDVQTVVTKVEFLDKRNLVSFLAKFFPVKGQLVQYLKKSEEAWSKEFKAQNETQTKVLKRSIASVEDEEKKNLLKKQQQEKESKKVRETFFYRTFYR